MAIYKYKLSYDKFPLFFREYEVKETNTLYELHRFIQNDLDFDEAQLAAFYTSDAAWKRHRTHPLFDMGEGSMDMITIAQLLKSKVQHLLYAFDLYNDRTFKLELLEETELTRLASYPRFVLGKNDPPDQLIDNEPVAALPFADMPVAEIPDVEDDDDEESEDEEEERYEEAEGQ